MDYHTLYVFLLQVFQSHKLNRDMGSEGSSRGKGILCGNVNASAHRVAAQTHVLHVPPDLCQAAEVARLAALAELNLEEIDQERDLKFGSSYSVNFCEFFCE